MCQSASKPSNESEIKCYRVYSLQNHPWVGIPTSYFLGHPISKLREEIVAKNTPFHAFLTKDDVSKFINCGATDKSLIFECILKNSLETGYWGSQRDIHTATGYTLMVVRRVGSYTKKRKLYWYKAA